MARHGRRLCLAILLGIAMLTTSACAVLLLGAGAGGAAGGTAYVLGELKVTKEMSLDEAWRRAQAAIKDLEFLLTSEVKDALSAKLTARTAGDKKVQIILNKHSNALTEIRIRVGVLGDDALSRLILEKIVS